MNDRGRLATEEARRARLRLRQQVQSDAPPATEMSVLVAGARYVAVLWLRLLVYVRNGLGRIYLR